MSDHQALYRETANYINSVIRRKAVTAHMFHQWVEQAKLIKQTSGTMGLVHHYKRLYKQVLSEREVEKLKNSARKNEFSYRLIDVLIEEGVLSPTQARWLKQYVNMK